MEGGRQRGRKEGRERGMDGGSEEYASEQAVSGSGRENKKRKRGMTEE